MSTELGAPLRCDASHPARREVRDDQSVRRRVCLASVGVALFASIVLFFELGDHRTLGSHEVFTAVPAREMLESGDWIVPTYGGLHRLRKPPLGYWVTASSSWLIGESSELSARLPSAVSALLLVGLVGWWAGRWYGARVGLWTAIVQTSSVFLVSYGRKSEVDMLLALLITAALCLIAHFDPADAWRRKFLIWFGLYALVGAAWMAKFHYGAAMVFGPGVVYLLVRGWRRSLWHPLNPAGLLVLAGCVGLWPYAVLQRAPEAASVWQNETLGRAVGTMGSEPIWFYLPVLLGLSLPWTGAALAQMRASWREAFRDKDRREQFLWVWFLVQLGIVTVSADKHANYLLPVFSVMSIWSGRWVSRVWVRVERGESLCSRRFAGAAGLAICVVGVVGWVLGSAKWSYVSIELAWVSIVIGLGAIVALWRAATRRTVSGAAVLATSFVLGYMLVQTSIIPRVDHRLASVEFSRAACTEASPDEPICVFRQSKAHSYLSPLVYYLGASAYRIEEAETLADRVADDGRVLAVAYEKDLAELRGLADVRVLREIENLPGQAPYRTLPVVFLELQRPSHDSAAPTSELVLNPKRRDTDRK